MNSTAAKIGLLIVVVLLAVWLSPVRPPDDEAIAAEAKKSCKPTEQEVRGYWVAATMHTKDENERVAIAEQTARAAEKLCFEMRTAKPPLLPDSLQRLVR